MVDPWESVDLTLTCESDGESPSTTDGEPVNTIPRPRVAENASGKVQPSLAEIFTEIYLSKCRGSSKRETLLECMVTQHENEDHPSISSSDQLPKRKLSEDSSLSITTSNQDFCKAKRKKLTPTFHLNSQDPEDTVNCVSFHTTVSKEEVIVIDDSSNDQMLVDPPGDDVGPTVIKNCSTSFGRHVESSSVPLEVAPPVTYPGPLVIASPEPQTSQVSLAMSKEPHLADVPHIDMDLRPAPQFISPVDYTETGSSGNSADEPENCQVQSPCKLYHCVLCKYRTIREDNFRIHIASHLPPKMFCTECSYSIGSEETLLVHMTTIHGILNPQIYISDKLLYTCRICKHAGELKTDIESHLKDRHSYQHAVAKSISPPSRKRCNGKATRYVPCDRTTSKLKLIFQCIEDGCARCCKDLHKLHFHIVNHHQIVPTAYYEYVPLKGRPSKDARYGCFSCDFKALDKVAIKRHAKTHCLRDENVGDGGNDGDLCRDKDTEDPDRQNHVASPGTGVASPEPDLTSLGPCEPSLEHHTTSPPQLDVIRSSEAAAPEPQVTPVSQTTCPEPNSVYDEQLVELSECNNTEESLATPCCLEDDRNTEKETESSDSDYDSDNHRGQSPRTFSCIYCDYTTVIEEWYHKHVATHLPDPKPYSRLYCTECSYSTGSEKFLLFHMAATHGIRNPEFYRSGEKMYTCRICRQTQEFRICIESHINQKHKTAENNQKHKTAEKIVRAKRKKTKDVEFRCSEQGCSKYCKGLQWLRTHAQKHHNIKYPLSYYECSLQTNDMRLACFHCNKTLKSDAVKVHARDHYTAKQRRAPYLYKCPLRNDDQICTFSCKKVSKLTEHYQSVHRVEVKYYKQLESTYACLNCSNKTSSQSVMEHHCFHACKKK